jgi:DNA helicase IV
MAHPELAQEQAYVDHAYECMERMRATLEGAQDRMATEFAAQAIEAWLKRRQKTFLDAERGLCFGRLSLEGLERPLYVGRRWVHDDRQDVLVVNWQAPAARAFYTATVAHPLGVERRRRFRAEGRTLLDLYDEPLDGSAGDVVHGVADILLEELERSRDERMRDIVATIQSDQYKLITREPEGVLVIQGGPGTGKTAVGLHRASWLLYTYREQFERSGVLVVGPNPVFMDYVSHVLPMLGEDRVEQRAVDEIVEGYAAKRVEKPELARAKGDVAIVEPIAAVVRGLRTVPDERLGIRVDGAYLYLEPDDLVAIGDEAADAGPYAQMRERFRMLVARRLYEQYGRKLDDLAFRSFDDLERGMRTFLTTVADSVFPRAKPDQIVKRALAAASLPAPRGWSDADLPLLDEARALLDGPPQQFGHVIVDEAQDLTPMQLRMLARRSTGSMTILGDIAQASGPVAYERWEEVLPFLAPDAEATVEELRLAYRVPREMMELALPLLPKIAPDVAPPIAYRGGDELPRFVEVGADELVAAAVREASHEAAREGRTALIAPADLLPTLPAIPADEMFQLLTPRGAKGLEFDRVVLVEPAAIVAAGEGVEGLRALYVALTRATKTLVVVHSLPLPDELRAAAA